MALIGDKLYVANHNAVVAFPYRTGQTRITARPEKIVSLPGGGNHWARNLVASPDGRFLYVTVGSASNIGEKGMDLEERRAAIWEVFPERKTFRIYAAGLRNPNGIAYEPNSGELWTTVNERDMLGGDGPPDYMTLVDFGAFYGWPYSYWGGYVDRRVQPERPDLLEYTRRPDYALGAHTAPLGLQFANGVSLGPNFANGAFVALHGLGTNIAPGTPNVLIQSGGLPLEKITPTSGSRWRANRAMSNPVVPCPRSTSRISTSNGRPLPCRAV
jgi:glucose/arabinose dehydrogenase